MLRALQDVDGEELTALKGARRACGTSVALCRTVPRSREGSPRSSQPSAGDRMVRSPA